MPNKGVDDEYPSTSGTNGIQNAVPNGVAEDENKGTPNASPENASPSNASPSNASPSNASPSNASPSNASPSNASPSNASPQNDSPQNASPQNASPQNGIPQDGIAQDGIAQDAIAQDGIAQDAIAQDAIAQDAIAQDAIAQDAIAQDAVPQDAVPQDAVPQDAAPQDAVPQDAVPQDAVPQDAIPQDAIPEDANPGPALANGDEAAAQAPGPSGAMRGHCKWFNVVKGWGFIKPNRQEGEEELPDVFVHQSVIQRSGFRSLGEQEEVEFEYVRTEKGLEATRVTGPEGRDCVGASRPPINRKKGRKIRCYNCGEFANHVAARCPMDRQPKRCHRCKSEDHLIAQCPQKNDRSHPNNGDREQRERDPDEDQPGAGAAGPAGPAAPAGPPPGNSCDPRPRPGGPA